MERANKPTALSSSAGKPLPQAQVTMSQDTDLVTAVLPSGDSVSVLLHGATVTSWKDGASGTERIWVSSAAKMDGSKPVRGGIPLCFPIFGPSPPDHEATTKLPQHGFARNSRWEFLGKGGDVEEGSQGVKLDFGLSAAQLDEAWKAKWPYEFGLVYSVTLSPGTLTTSLVVSNEGDEPFDCQVLMHSYFRIKDIADTAVTGLESSSFVDKMDGAKVKTQSGGVQLSGPADRVYKPDTEPSTALTILEGGSKTLSIVRDNLADVVVWNPWEQGAAGMGDFEPKDGWKQMICVEAGSVRGWTKLEKGDVWEGAQTLTAL